MSEGPQRRIEVARAVHNAIAEMAGAYGRLLSEVAGEVQLLEALVARQAKTIEDQAKLLDEIRVERAAIAAALPPGTGTLAERVSALVLADRLAGEP